MTDSILGATEAPDDSETLKLTELYSAINKARRDRRLRLRRQQLQQRRLLPTSPNAIRSQKMRAYYSNNPQAARRRSEFMKNFWANPKYRQMLIELKRESFIQIKQRRKAERKLRRYRKASESMKRFWANPENKARMLLSIKQASKESKQIQANKANQLN